MEHFTVQFNSYGTFTQMNMNEHDEENEVELFCQTDNSKGEYVKEIIFNLYTPKKYNSEQAQFSICKEEAKLLINVFKFHFGL